MHRGGTTTTNACISNKGFKCGHRVHALATVLPLCTALKKLDLGCNLFTGAGVDGLVPVVLQCPQFEWVGLESRYIDDMSDETKDAMRTSKVRFSRKSDVWKSDGEFEVELSDEDEDGQYAQNGSDEEEDGEDAQNGGEDGEEQEDGE